MADQEGKDKHRDLEQDAPPRRLLILSGRRRRAPFWSSSSRRILHHRRSLTAGELRRWTPPRVSRVLSGFSNSQTLRINALMPRGSRRSSRRLRKQVRSFDPPLNCLVIRWHTYLEVMLWLDGDERLRSFQLSRDADASILSLFSSLPSTSPQHWLFL